MGMTMEAKCFFYICHTHRDGVCSPSAAVGGGGVYQRHMDLFRSLNLALEQMDY